MRAGSLFSGYGGLDLAVEAITGATTAWHVEVDPAASKVLAARWPGVPNLGDITAVDWSEVEPVDVLSGGFPCQDLSLAGGRAGLRPGTRSGLWAHFAYAITQLRPRLVVVENVRGLLSASAHSDMERCPWCVGDRADDCLRALGAVLADLAEIRYDAVWCGLRASDVGAPHERFRVFILAADTDSQAGAEPWGVAPGAPQGVAGETLRGVGRGRGSPAADPDRSGREGSEPARRRDLSARGATTNADRFGPERAGSERDRRAGPADRGGEAAADTDGGGCGRDESGARRGPVGGDAADRDSPAGVDWGTYGPAVRRWELILGRPAPHPTMRGARGATVLSPELPEWMMGLPAGWVTGVPGLSRRDMLRILGNGVVPQQAAAALRHLLPLLCPVGERAA